jgi:hypothetical protein
MTNNYCDYEYEISSTHKDNTVTNEINNKWRVKLYHLNEEGQWDDKGTGHVHIIKQVKL